MLKDNNKCLDIALKAMTTLDNDDEHLDNNDDWQRRLRSTKTMLSNDNDKEDADGWTSLTTMMHLLFDMTATP